MRIDPERLIAFALPLLLSAITVEISIDRKESRASVPMAKPRRANTESRRARVMDVKKSLTGCIEAYPHCAAERGGLPGGFGLIFSSY